MKYMRKVGQGKPAVDQWRVRYLQRVAGINQLLGRSSHVLPPVAVKRVGTPPVTRKTRGLVARELLTTPLNALISAAIALAPNTGSRKTPSVRATSRAASVPPAEAMP